VGDADQLGDWRVSFALSRDPRFEDKLLDVVGLYMDPPEHALVLGCDEKSQIQVLNRTKPGLPMKRGRVGTPSPMTTSATARPRLDGRPSISTEQSGALHCYRQFASQATSVAARLQPNSLCEARRFRTGCERMPENG
jgi:hypothetical protein